MQIFIQDLNWPEEEFSKYLQIRMKALASEMINKCTNWYVWNWTKSNMILINFILFFYINLNCFSTYQCFDSYMQRARKSTDYVLPSEVCVMINVIFSSKSRAAKMAIDSGEVCLSILINNQISWNRLLKSALACYSAS